MTGLLTNGSQRDCQRRYDLKSAHIAG